MPLNDLAKFYNDCPTFKRTKERKEGKSISNAKRSLKLCHAHKNKTTSTTSKEAYRQNNQMKQNQKHEKTSRSETGTDKNKNTKNKQQQIKTNTKTKTKQNKTKPKKNKQTNKIRLILGSCSFIYPQSIKIVNQSAILPDTAAISRSVDVFPFVVTIFVTVVVPGGFVLLGTGWRKQTP